jgi:putative component of membrane protein insertase Oxa1/YidC/SpoIIIJ protein YidD
MLGIGMIFLCAGRASSEPAPLALAAELAGEGDWASARREALRVLAANPAHDPALLLAADAALQLDPANAAALGTLEHLSTNAADPALKSRAAYRAGQAHWARGDRSAAWTAYARAFQHPEDRAAFLRSGCALFLLRREEETLGADNPALLQQLATCRNLWTFPLRDEVRVKPMEPGRRVAARPAEWIVAFYRSQIGPGIGHRCSLEPSCSAYFLEASRAHGALGVPLIADRLVREPDVVKYAEDPIERNGRTLYRDPLERHTDWMRDE